MNALKAASAKKKSTDISSGDIHLLLVNGLLFVYEEYNMVHVPLMGL
jgi:hypothetical protein